MIDKNDNPFDVTISDLQEHHRQYAKIIGIDKFLALSKEFGGTQIYIPKISELSKNATYNAVIKEFEAGEKIKQISKKYQISESTIYRLVREQIKGK